MKTILALLCALVLGCAANPLAGNPTSKISASIPQLDNGCLPEAVRCCEDLKGSHAEARVLLIAYTQDGKRYGHAMAVYWWPARPSPYAVHYAYDRTNASTALPKDLDPDSALTIAMYMIPSAVYAEWSGEPVN